MSNDPTLTAIADDWWPQANPDALRHVREKALPRPDWETLAASLTWLSEPPSFPLDAVRMAQAGWPSYAVHFRAAFESVLDTPLICKGGRYMLHMIAGALLAEHRDTASFAIAQRWMALPLDTLLMTLGESWHEPMSEWLAAFACGKPERLQWVADCAMNREFFAGKRHAAVDALGRNCTAGEYPPADYEALCLAVMHDVAEHGVVEEPEDFMDAPALMELTLGSMLDFGASEATLLQVQQWFAAGLFDAELMSYDDLLREVADLDGNSQRPALPGCTVKQIGWWAWFNESPEHPGGASVPRHVDTLEDAALSGLPYVRPEAKVGRNDPCPCGSGLKFKKCCGAAG